VTEQHDADLLREIIESGMCTTYDDDLDRIAKRIEALESRQRALREALEKIERWFGEFPETGKFWPNVDGITSDRPMSYGSAFGSNGERDYMRAVARAALGDA
jgi:hypothetical protein